MLPKEILITGGAGFLAATLAARFRKDGVSVRLLDVRKCPTWACRPGIQYFRGDIRDPAAVTGALKGADAVVHAAFAPPYHSSEAIRSVNVDGTRNLAECAVKQQTQRVILISSTIVLKPRRVHPFFRRSPLNQLDVYRASRAEAESIAAAYESKGLATAIVRPKTFLGPGRVSAFAILLERIRHGRSVPVLGNGRNRYQLLDIRDLAEGIRLLTSADARGVFSFGAREYRTVREDLQKIVDHSDTGARLQFISPTVARALLRGMEMANLMPLSEWHYMSARGDDSVVDISRAENELGWRPKKSNAQALQDTYDWYIATIAKQGTAKTAHPVPFAHQLLKKLSSILP